MDIDFIRNSLAISTMHEVCIIRPSKRLDFSPLSTKVLLVSYTPRVSYNVMHSLGTKDEFMSDLCICSVLCFFYISDTATNGAPSLFAATVNPVQNAVIISAASLLNTTSVHEFVLDLRVGHYCLCEMFYIDICKFVYHYGNHKPLISLA